MLVLGVETSCDETGIALLEVGPGASAQDIPRGIIRGQALHSQVDLHRLYGGVVPELASRDHLLRLLPLLEQTLREAACPPEAIDRVAVTQGPGLAGALLVGTGFAYGLAAALNRPVMAVHHLEGHLLSPLLDAPGLGFPFVALLVSGGHTQLLEVIDIGVYTLLGETIDDACGEAFDKSAQLLGLGYPGGPEIAKLAETGHLGRFPLPRPLLNRQTLDFSFAGLKTAVLTHVKKAGGLDGLSGQDRADLAAETQQAIVDVLVAKAMDALAATGHQSLVVAGGVSANKLLRAQLSARAHAAGAAVFYPPTSLCTDNGVMIAWAGALRGLRGEPGRAAGAFAVQPRWPLEALGLAPALA